MDIFSNRTVILAEQYFVGVFFAWHSTETSNVPSIYIFCSKAILKFWFRYLTYGFQDLDTIKQALNNTQNTHIYVILP